jgi:hypothetical protein
MSVVYGQWGRMDGETGSTIDAAFQICGSSLFETYPDFIEIRIGSLDKATSSIGAPEREKWTKRREHWLSPMAGAEQASEDARDADIVPS